MVTTLLGSLSWAGPIVESTVPGNQTRGSADWAYKLDILDVENTSVLRTMAPWLEYDPGTYGEDELHLVVYAEDSTDDWDLVWDSGLVGPVGQSGRFYAADPDLTLEGGRRYAIGVVFLEGNFAYRYESGPGETRFSWGRHVGAIYVGSDSLGSVPNRIDNQGPQDVGYWMELTVEVLDVDGDGATEDLDCDDLDPRVYVGAPEYCDLADNDCDGVVDDNVVYVDHYPDADGDGHGDGAAPESSCDGNVPDGYLTDGGDCDDTDADVHPGVPEYCDGEDEDCSGVADDDPVTSTAYEDLDGDGFGGSPVTWCTREPPPGTFVAEPLDCDDARNDVFPAAIEVCDGVDQDCDEFVDDGLPSVLLWLDGDGDGAGDPDQPAERCVEGGGYVDNAVDCDDSDARRAPGNDELCNGLDDNCDGLAGGEGDFDGDGYIDCRDCASADPSTYPGAPEACDGVDHDCDGVVHDRLECDPAPSEDIAVVACGGCAVGGPAGGGAWVVSLVGLALGAAGRRRRW